MHFKYFNNLDQDLNQSKIESKFIDILENSYGMKTINDLHTLQPRELKAPSKNTDLLESQVDFRFSIYNKVSAYKFAKCYIDYYKN